MPAGLHNIRVRSNFSLTLRNISKRIYHIYAIRYYKDHGMSVEMPASYSYTHAKHTSQYLRNATIGVTILYNIDHIHPDRNSRICHTACVRELHTKMAHLDLIRLPYDLPNLLSHVYCHQIH